MSMVPLIEKLGYSMLTVRNIDGRAFLRCMTHSDSIVEFTNACIFLAQIRVVYKYKSASFTPCTCVSEKFSLQYFVRTHFVVMSGVVNLYLYATCI